MTEESAGGKRGPKPTYERRSGYAKGAPRLATRVDPDVLEWVESRPEGARPYIQRIVREDRARTLAENPETAAEGVEENSAPVSTALGVAVSAVARVISSLPTERQREAGSSISPNPADV